MTQICFDSLSKATDKEHDHTKPWRLRAVLEDVLEMTKELDQVRFK